MRSDVLAPGSTVIDMFTQETVGVVDDLHVFAVPVDGHQGHAPLVEAPVEWRRRGSSSSTAREVTGSARCVQARKQRRDRAGEQRDRRSEMVGSIFESFVPCRPVAHFMFSADQVSGHMSS